jgi:hypothetical protein
MKTITRTQLHTRVLFTLDSFFSLNKHDYPRSLVPLNSSKRLCAALCHEQPRTISARDARLYIGTSERNLFFSSFLRTHLIWVQILERITAKTSVDCLSLFRHLMVDVFVASSYGYSVGALGKWAADVEDALCTAIHDFPIRGIIVSAIVPDTRASRSQTSNSEAPFPIGLGISFAKFQIIVGVK